MFRICLLFLLIWQVHLVQAQVLSSREVIDRMLSATREVETLKFKFKKVERIGGKTLTGEQDVKYLHTPRKTYAYLHSPGKGTEVLWIENENSGKVLVKPSSFPYVAVSLSPFGSVIRKNNHHTVHEIGFDYIAGIIGNIAAKSGNQFDQYFLYQGEVIFENRHCYKILIDYAPYQYISYTVQPGEDLPTIAKKLYVSDYMIKEINPDVDDYDDVRAGQQIKVPNAYARKTVLYVDKKNYLPLVQKMYDEKGLFAHYEFHNLELNPPIKAEEFSREYAGYNF
jgi:outer membrane lipoprotein-sorting protein